jgi:glycosyltransferase involved in cell wall biosynthesis
LRSLIRLLRREAPEFVFTAMPAANVLVSAAAILAGVRTRMVVFHHSPVDTYKPLLNAVDSVLGLLWHVKAIVSVSSAVEASLDTKPRAYRAKRQTIHNALPPRIEAQLGTLAVGERRCRVVSRKVVATGRLAVQKNYPVLVRASAEMPDVEVLIIGAGPDEEMLKTLAHELGVEQRIRFLGQFPRDEALKLLAAGDVFVQPSLFEGHSLGLIEAAKLAMPLVVSNVPVQIEGITASDGTRCGIVVDPHDPMALASEIRRLLDEPEHYRHWAERARHLASSSSFDDMLTAYAALIT